MDVDIKPKETDLPTTKPDPPPIHRTKALSQDVTRSDPNLNGSEPEPVILKSVPSLKNLSENCLPDRVSKMNPKLLLQSRSLGVDNRPIYPNCPFSPYASPTGSPRSNRKRQPLKESRRVSIGKTGMYIQLNQYKLLDSIGQV